MHTAAEILPAAEAAGMLHEIDRHVLELAIAILDQRVGENRPVRLFVSQSARTLTRDGYAATLLGMLQGTRIDGPSLVIDVRSEEHTSELPSLMRISYAVLCLNTKTTS